MVIHPKTAEKENTSELEDKVFFKAEELFMTIGIRNTTMDDLAQELGISKKTLYKTIDNKADLVYKCVMFDIARKQREIKTIQDNSNNALEEMLQIGALIVASVGRYRLAIIHDLMKFYPESWQKVTEHKKTFIAAIIQQNIEKGIQQELYRTNIDKKYYANFFVLGTDICLTPQFEIEAEHTTSNVFREFMLYHLHAIIQKDKQQELHELIKRMKF